MMPSAGATSDDIPGEVRVSPGGNGRWVVSWSNSKVGEVTV